MLVNSISSLNGTKIYNSKNPKGIKSNKPVAFGIFIGPSGIYTDEFAKLCKKLIKEPIEIRNTKIEKFLNGVRELMNKCREETKLVEEDVQRVSNDFKNLIHDLEYNSAKCEQLGSTEIDGFPNCPFSTGKDYRARFDVIAAEVPEPGPKEKDFWDAWKFNLI